MKIKQIEDIGFKIIASHPYKARKKVNISFGLFSNESKTLFSDTDVSVLSISQNSALKNKKNIFIIDSPGEYETQGIFIQGISWIDKNMKPNLLYVLEAEKMRICSFSILPQQELSSKCLERIGSIDVLIMPIGQQKDVFLKDIKNIISQIEPSLVIFLKQKSDKVAKKETDNFLKAIGAKLSEEKNQMSFEKSDLDGNKRKFVVIDS